MFHSLRDKESEHEVDGTEFEERAKAVLDLIRINSEEPIFRAGVDIYTYSISTLRLTSIPVRDMV